MSKTPKLRFKEFSGDWEENKLQNISDVRDGTHDSPKYVSEGYPFITSKNLMTNGKIDFSDINYITESDYININKRSKVDIGDILFGMIGTIGNPVIVEQDGFAIKNVALIKEKDKLLNRYLIQVLKSSVIDRQFYKLNTGGTQKFIGLGMIRDLNILTPKVEEQEKIASFFSLIDDKISLQGEKVEALKDYKKGMMQKIFSRELRFKDDDGEYYPEWEEKKLGDIVETITDYVAAGSFESIRNNVTYIDNSSYAQLVRTVDLKHKFNNKNFVYVDENAFNFLYRVNLNKECTILPNIGANIGESYFIKPELLPHKFNVLAPNAILLHSDENNNRYLYYLLNTRAFHKQLDCMVGASGQPKFNKTELKQMKFKVASLHEQNKICTILERLDLKIEKEQEKLDSLNEYKKGLLQKMFV